MATAYRRVYVAQNPAQAESIRAALAAEGISAQVLANDDGQKDLIIEILVPVGEEKRASQVISESHFPRFA